LTRLAGVPIDPVELTIFEALERSPGSIATVSEDATLTCDELREASSRLASGLIGLGVRPGDRVALLASNRPEFLVCVAAVASAGGILVPLNTRSSPPELRRVLAHSEASVAVAERSFRGLAFVDTLLELQGGLPTLAHVVALDEARQLDTSTAPLPEVRPSDPAVLIYTSGTTGDPKGCLHAHGTLVTNATVNARRKQLSTNDRVISSVPFFNVFGLLNCILESFVSGATIVVQPTFDTADALGLIRREHVTAFLGTPTMWIRLEEHPDFSEEGVETLRTGSIGGSPVPRDLLERWRARGCDIAVIYGMSEAPTILLDGGPTPGLEVEIGADGQLRTRGYNHMLEYFHDPAATRERIRDGWLRTGDLAEIAEGRIRVVGRADDMMIVGGFNVQPVEVEQALREHPDISDAAAFGLPERELGEVVAAWIVLRPGAAYDEQALRQFCRDRLAKYKVPRHLRVVEEFPLTPNGKVQRFRMRDSMLGELEPAARSSVS
jgi:acyl-CoA synthetase (AMP-forming)/AMP-acid ligase II